MPGFLDAKERVIDMVLTDTGKNLLLKGGLQFVYWIPFDDEVDYDPHVNDSGSRDAGDLAIRKQELTETPLIREATMGYRGLNYREEDTTNVNRPMYSAPPGVGQNYPLPQLVPSFTGTTVSVKQALMTSYGPENEPPQVIGIRRYDATISNLDVRYDAASFPVDTQTEGFLITLYKSSSLKVDETGSVIGGFQEVLHNIDSSGSIAYLNDLRLYNHTP